MAGQQEIMANILGTSPVVGEEVLEAVTEQAEEVQSELFEDEELGEAVEEAGEAVEEEIGDSEETLAATEEDEVADEDAAGELEPDTLEVNDEDLIEVKIDGKVELKTLGELKAAISGAGAVDKRLQEATEARNAVQTERSEWLKEAHEAQAVVGKVIQTVADRLFSGTVAKPDEALRVSNPQAYLLQKEAWTEDVNRVNVGRQQLGALFKQHQDAIDHQKVTFRQEQAMMLGDKLPELRDEKTGPKLQEAMVKNAMTTYGLSPQEIAAQSDHRLFMMALDAYKYRQSLLGGKTVVDDIKKDIKVRKPRTLRSGNLNGAKRKARQSASTRKAVVDTARKSGKVGDIAATILKSQK